MHRQFTFNVANQPRIYCPKCGSPARRVYYQDAGDKKASHNWKAIPGWAFCPSGHGCFAPK